MELVEPIRDKKQIDNMKRYFKQSNYRDYLLFVLGINSALRISDLLKLKVSDVQNKDRITVREKKTGKLKDFPLSSNCIQAIHEYLKESNLTDNDYLFKSRKGNKAITREQAYRIINHASKQVGIDGHIGTHTLRKTFGYWAYKSGVSVEVIQKLLNHSSPSITLRYIGITQQQLDDVYINLNL